MKYEELSYDDKIKMYNEIINKPGGVIAVPDIKNFKTQVPPKMTLLQWYTGMALNGLIGKYAHPYPGNPRMMINPAGCAAACIDFVEYLIKALEKKEEQARNPKSND